MNDLNLPPALERFVPRTRVQWVLALVLLSAIFFLPFLGWQQVMTADEGQRTVPPREMLRDGDWAVPRLNGHPYLKKPPLLYWQITPFYRALGHTEFAARLPVALMGIALVVVAFLWASRFSSLRTAALAGVMVAGNFIVVEKSRECQLDIPMTLCTLGALWAWWSAFGQLERGDGPRVLWPALLGGVLLGVGNLYKVPMPFIFVGAAWLGCIAVMRRWRWLLRWEWYAGFALGFLPLALWGAAVVHSVGFERAYAIWFKEFELHAVKATKINSGPPWYYAVRIVACFIPWCVLMPVLLTRGFREAQRGRWLTFSYLWTCVAVSFVFLSVNTSKETEYMLGLVPPLCILLAWAWEYAAGRGVAPFGRWLYPGWLLAGGLAAWLVAGGVVIPLMGWKAALKHDAPRVAAEANRAVASGRTVVCMGLEETKPYVYFYLDKTLPLLWADAEVPGFFAEHPDGLILTRGERTASFSAAAGKPMRVVAESGPAGKVFLIGAVDDATAGTSGTLQAAR